MALGGILIKSVLYTLCGGFSLAEASLSLDSGWALLPSKSEFCHVVCCRRCAKQACIAKFDTCSLSLHGCDVPPALSVRRAICKEGQDCNGDSCCKGCGVGNWGRGFLMRP